jgi:outer membrane protein OmpA-like peptidoglycan-associated protein
MEPGISYSTKLDNGTWMQPIALKIPDMNVQRGYLGAYMCKSEKLLFLSYKGDNAIGREDLYVTEKKDDGTWTKPINLGNVVNSVGFELSPFYNEEDSTLYFASNGHEGLGDADIFKSKRLDGNSWTKWSKPQNLGTFFNGDGFDAYFYYNSADSTIYFSKEDPENNYTDIHFTHLRNLTEALRRIEEKKKPKIDSSLAANNTGLAATLAKEADEQRKAEEELNKRERIQIQDFDNVLFDFAKHDLRPEARKRLDKLYNFMVKNPSVGVEIIGHADSIDTELVNLILSVKRSEECKNYIINKGISKRRILTHGFGKQLPVATNRTEEGRQQNRRAEINILVDNKSKGKLEYMPKVMEAGGGGRK